jgi:hypothetical protein
MVFWGAAMVVIYAAALSYMLKQKGKEDEV